MWLTCVCQHCIAAMHQHGTYTEGAWGSAQAAPRVVRVVPPPFPFPEQWPALADARYAHTFTRTWLGSDAAQWHGAAGSVGVLGAHPRPVPGGHTRMTCAGVRQPHGHVPCEPTAFPGGPGIDVAAWRAPAEAAAPTHGTDAHGAVDGDTPGSVGGLELTDEWAERFRASARRRAARTLPPVACDVRGAR